MQPSVARVGDAFLATVTVGLRTQPWQYVAATGKDGKCIINFNFLLKCVRTLAIGLQG